MNDANIRFASMFNREESRKMRKDKNCKSVVMMDTLYYKYI